MDPPPFGSGAIVRRYISKAFKLSQKIRYSGKINRGLVLPPNKPSLKSTKTTPTPLRGGPAPADLMAACARAFSDSGMSSLPDKHVAPREEDHFCAGRISVERKIFCQDLANRRKKSLGNGFQHACSHQQINVTGEKVNFAT